MQVPDPPTLYVTFDKYYKSQPQFPHINNEMMGVAQWFSTPAVQISPFRQDGMTFPPQVTENHNIYETEAFKMQGARQRNRDEKQMK